MELVGESDWLEGTVGKSWARRDSVRLRAKLNQITVDEAESSEREVARGAS